MRHRGVYGEQRAEICARRVEWTRPDVQLKVAKPKSWTICSRIYPAVVVLACAALGGCAAGKRERAALQTIAEPPEGMLYYGFLPGGKNGMGSDFTPAEVASFEQATGKRPTWIYICDNWYEGRRFPRKAAEFVRARGSIPYFRLMLLSGQPIPLPDPVYSLENILRGQFDEDLRRWMRDAREFGGPLMAEYGVEANGFWFPWNGKYNREGGTYADAVDRFRRVYRHIVEISREEGARNIRWVFHVDPWDEPAEDWNRFENYYPGDEWVDWAGVSVYGRQVPSDIYYPSFRTQMDWVYGRLMKVAPTKPVIVCEFGTIKDQGQARWTQAALEDLIGRRWPRVIGFAWWNAQFYNDPKDKGSRSVMTIEDSPDVVEIFRRYVGREPRVLAGAAVEQLK